MKELRELLAKGTQGKWYARNYTVYTHTGDGVCRVADVNTSADPDLIAAMHNALPELLDAWEMVQKIDEWAKTPSGIQSAVTLGGYQYAQFDVEKMIRQWRDAHADTKTD